MCSCITVCLALQTVEDQHLKCLHVSTSYTMILYNSVYQCEVLVHGNSTFVCSLHKAAEQCGHVLETWLLSVVFDQTV